MKHKTGNIRFQFISKMILKIISKILFLLLIFGGVALTAVFTNSIYGYMTILYLITLMCVSLIAMEYIRRSIQIESDFLDRECSRGQTVSIGLKIYNRSILTCPRVIAQIHVVNFLGEEESLTKTYLTLPSRIPCNFGFDMDMPHIGVYQVGIKQMDVYGFFGFFHRKVILNKEFEVISKPNLKDVDHILAENVLQDQTNSENGISTQGGSDYVGVREYAYGDSMKQVHWKLSAHSSGYMTKLHESYRQLDFSVVLDFACNNNNKEELLDINDCLIETALSLLQEISKQHTSYSLIYTDKDKNMKRVSKNEISHDAVELVKDFSFVVPEPDKNYPDAVEILQNESQMANKSSNLIICTSRITEELIQEILLMRRQKRTVSLYYITSSSFHMRKKEEITKKLQGFDELSIPYYFVSANQRDVA